MADPQKRAARAQDNAAIQAVRAGDDDTAQDILRAGTVDIEHSAPSPVDIINQRLQSGRAGVPDVATAQAVEDLATKVKELRQYIDEFRKRQNEINKDNTKAWTAARRWMGKYRDAFSTFHEEASSVRDTTSFGLETAAAAVNGYMDGINFGEVSANPQYLALAKVLEATQQAGNPILGGMGAVAGSVLRYLAYVNPLASDVSAATVSSSQAALLR